MLIELDQLGKGALVSRRDPATEGSGPRVLALASQRATGHGHFRRPRGRSIRRGRGRVGLRGRRRWHRSEAERASAPPLGRIRSGRCRLPHRRRHILSTPRRRGGSRHPRARPEFLGRTRTSDQTFLASSGRAAFRAGRGADAPRDRASEATGTWLRRRRSLRLASAPLVRREACEVMRGHPGASSPIDGTQRGSAGRGQASPGSTTGATQIAAPSREPPSGRSPTRSRMRRPTGSIPEGRTRTIRTDGSATRSAMSALAASVP